MPNNECILVYYVYNRKLWHEIFTSGYLM
jgi:hypothetical protein